MKYTPDNCPNCAYDRQFPGFESGGWIEQPNNGGIHACPLCNPHGDRERAWEMAEAQRSHQRMKA